MLGDDVDPSCNLNWASHKRRAVALAVALFRWLRRRAQLRSLAKFLSDEPVAIAYAPATQRESLGDDDAERRVSPARRRAESLA